MSPQESARLVGVISAAYPHRPVGPETVKVYATLMQDLEYPTASRAVAECVKASKFPPSVAEIREAYAHIAADEKRARALPMPYLPEISETERQENLKLVREYAQKIGLKIEAA